MLGGRPFESEGGTVTGGGINVDTTHIENLSNRASPAITTAEKHNGGVPGSSLADETSGPPTADEPRNSEPQGRKGWNLARNTLLTASRTIEDIKEATAAGRLSSRRKVNPLRALLVDSTATASAVDVGFFGSIRFPSAPRALPSKFIRLSSAHDPHDMEESIRYSRHVVDLLLHTWKLEPPCAMISIASTSHTADHISARLELVLRRGLAQAAQRTNAWVITSGCAHDVAARTAGRAMSDLQAEQGEFRPIIGVLSWQACCEQPQLKMLPNGMVHQYHHRAAAVDQAGTTEVVDLDSNHSHFLMVDNEKQDQVSLLRHRVERYVSDNDISNDNIQTPKVVILICGDSDTFQAIHDSLDPNDVETGTAVPVLIVSDSGGAAEDIYKYCHVGELPTVGVERDSLYVDLATRYLPEIKRLGELTGQNSRPQLSFFTLSADLDARQDLGLVIQNALLNDCPNVKQEALLAVAWREPPILQRQLEDHAEALLMVTKTGSGATPEANVDLLEVALTRSQDGDISVVQTLLDFIAQPHQVRMDELFIVKFNRYPVKATQDLWVGRKRKKRRAAGSRRSKASQVVPEEPLSGRNSRDSIGPDSGAATPEVASSVYRQVGRQSSNELPLALDTDAQAEADTWSAARQVLSRMVDGYEAHLDARAQLYGTLTPTWTDLMMWAVLGGQTKLSKALWEKSETPLRAALMASQLCRRLHIDPNLRADRDELLEKSNEYEDLAIDLLDSIRETDDAVPLLTLVPWEYIGGDTSATGTSGLPRRAFLWECSALESAAEEDGLLSVPCMRFISHRHCQTLLDRYFVGDYPGSKAQIPITHSSLTFITLQALMPFLPGTVVEVMPCTEPENVQLSGESVKQDHEREKGTGGELDPDLIDALDDLNKGNNADENTLADLFEDFIGLRFLLFYFVPKVKFSLVVASHVAFMAYLTYFLLHVYNADTIGSQRISTTEIVFWMWSLTRFIGEFTEFDFQKDGLAGFRLYARDMWNQMARDQQQSNQNDMLTFALILIVAVLRSLASSESQPFSTYQALKVSGGPIEYMSNMELAARNLYAVVIILVYVRLLQFLRYFRSLGVLSIVLGHMIRDVSIFAMLQALFTTSFGIAFAVLLPSKQTSTSWHTFMTSPVVEPFWGLYGSFSTTVLEEDTNGVLPTALTAPLLLWLYLFIATIVLINLLIAQMSDTYARITTEGIIRWQFERSQLISEFCSGNSPAPPPLNIIWIALVMIPNRLRHKKDDKVSGFKKLPTKKELRRYEQQEADALKRCLAMQSKRQAAEVDEKMNLVLNSLHKQEEQNRMRYEILNGRMDQLVQKPFAL